MTTDYKAVRFFCDLIGLCSPAELPTAYEE